MNDRLLLRFHGHSPRLRVSAPPRVSIAGFMVNFKIDLELFKTTTAGRGTGGWGGRRYRIDRSAAVRRHPGTAGL